MNTISRHPAAAAVEVVVHSTTSDELRRAVGLGHALAVQKKGEETLLVLSASLDDNDMVPQRQEPLDALFNLALQCISLASAVDADFDDGAAASSGLDELDWGGYFGIAVAEVTANSLRAMAAGLDAEPSERGVDVLERLSLELDIFFAAHLFGELCRLEFRGQRLEEQEERLLLALQGICAWTLASVGRAVGYSSFSGSVLWEWASGDALWAFILSKGVLSMLPRNSCRPTAVAAPEELANLQYAVLTAVCELASGAVVLASETGGDGVAITFWNSLLACRRTDLATSIVTCQLLPVLLDAAWRMGPSVAPGLTSFLVSLLQQSLALPDIGAESESSAEILAAAQRASEVLAQHLSSCADSLWRFLAEAPSAFGVYLQVQFIHDCADLAFSVPPPDRGVCFLGACTASFSDPGSAAALCILVANAGMQLDEPGAFSFKEALVGVLATSRELVDTRCNTWRGPIKRCMFQNWAAFMGTSTGDPVVSTSPEVVVGEAAALCFSSQPVHIAAAAAPATVRTGRLGEIVRDAPAAFRCSFDGQLMMDPVRSPFGHVFERISLVGALNASDGHCPITGQLLSITDCERVPELRRQITTWVRQQDPDRKTRPQLAIAKAR